MKAPADAEDRAAFLQPPRLPAGVQLPQTMQEDAERLDCGGGLSDDVMASAARHVLFGCLMVSRYALGQRRSG